MVGLSHPYKDEVLIIRNGIYMGTWRLAFIPTCVWRDTFKHLEMVDLATMAGEV